MSESSVPSEPNEAGLPLEHSSAEPVTPMRLPLPWITIALAVINVAVFGWEISQGGDVVQPTAQWMAEHGGNFGPLTFDGQPWRLFTSMFLHYGVLHIAMNMVGLIDGGRHVERMYGPVGFIVLYLLAGVAGSFASALRSNVVSAGASGAIFGVFGAFGAFLFMHRNRLDKEQVKKQARGLIIFLAYNVFFGVTQSSIDLVAHAGGLAAGFVVGIALEVGSDHGHSTKPRSLLVFAVGAAIIAGALFLVPRPDHSLETFAKSEAALLARWNTVVGQVQTGAIADPAFGDVIEKEILPPWRTARAAYEKDAEAGSVRTLMLEYMTAREEGWTIVLEAVRTDDREKMARGTTRFKEADAMIQKLGDKK